MKELLVLRVAKRIKSPKSGRLRQGDCEFHTSLDGIARLVFPCKRKYWNLNSQTYTERMDVVACF